MPEDASERAVKPETHFRASERGHWIAQKRMEAKGKEGPPTPPRSSCLPARRDRKSVCKRQHISEGNIAAKNVPSHAPAYSLSLSKHMTPPRGGNRGSYDYYGAKNRLFRLNTDP